MAAFNGVVFPTDLTAYRQRLRAPFSLRVGEMRFAVMKPWLRTSVFRAALVERLLRAKNRGGLVIAGSYDKEERDEPGLLQPKFATEGETR